MGFIIWDHPSKQLIQIERHPPHMWQKKNGKFTKHWRNYKSLLELRHKKWFYLRLYVAVMPFHLISKNEIPMVPSSEQSLILIQPNTRKTNPTSPTQTNYSANLSHLIKDPIKPALKESCRTHAVMCTSLPLLWLTLGEKLYVPKKLLWQKY